MTENTSTSSSDQANTSRTESFIFFFLVKPSFRGRKPPDRARVCQACLTESFNVAGVVAFVFGLEPSSGGLSLAVLLITGNTSGKKLEEEEEEHKRRMWASVWRMLWVLGGAAEIRQSELIVGRIYAESHKISRRVG